MRVKRVVRKYWHIFQITWQEVLMYRGELFLWTIIDAMPVLSMLLLWLAVYRYGDTLGSFDLASLITYFVVGHLASSLVGVHFELDAVQHILDGTMSRYIVKPISYLKMAVIGETGWKALSLIFVTIPLSVGLILFLKPWILLPQPVHMAWMVVFMVAAYAIEVLLSALIVGLAFYLDQGRALSHFKWMVSGVLGGSMLPLAAYPSSLERFARLLPFQFSFAVPLEVYLGQQEQMLRLLVLAGAWIIILSFLVRITWKRSLKHFTAVGN